MQETKIVTEIITVRVSKAFYEYVKRRASANNISIAHYARRALVDYIRSENPRCAMRDALHQTKEKENEKEKRQKKELREKGSTHKTRARPLFVVPMLDECKAYAASNPLCDDVDVEAFYDHYTSNGWKVSGRAPMKDWKAALRNWARRDNSILSRNREDAKVAARDAQAKRDRAAFVRDRARMAKTREAWILCEERCACWQDKPGCYCREGAKWPPSLNDRPIPPEECSRFQGFDKFDKFDKFEKLEPLEPSQTPQNPSNIQYPISNIQQPISNLPRHH